MDLLDVIGHRPLFLRREALAAGIDDGALRRALRHGGLARVRHGVYADSAWWRDASEDRRHVELAQAVSRMLTAPIVFSHQTAAALHGLPTWGLDLGHLHVTHLGPAGGRVQAGLVHHRSSLAGNDSTAIDGLPVTSAARTVVDCIKVTTSESGLVLASAALHAGLTDHANLRRQVLLQEHDPSTLRARVIVGRADHRLASVGESRSLHLFITQQLPRPQLQVPIRDWTGSLIGIVDFAWPQYCLIVEFDGRVKYSTLLRPGETTVDAIVREKEREDRIREATGWTVLRLTWDDLARPKRTAQRIRNAMRRGGSTAV